MPTSGLEAGLRCRAGRRIGQTKDRRSPSHRTTIDEQPGQGPLARILSAELGHCQLLGSSSVRRPGLGPLLHERQEVALAIASPLLGDEDRRHAGLAGKRCSRLASQQQRQDVAFEPLRATSSGVAQGTVEPGIGNLLVRPLRHRRAQNSHPFTSGRCRPRADRRSRTCRRSTSSNSIVATADDDRLAERWTCGQPAPAASLRGYRLPIGRTPCG